MKKISVLSLPGLLLLTACVNLDVLPNNIVTDDDLFTSENGIKIYLARMYSQMPFEDFKYMAEWGLEYNAWLGSTGIEGTGEAVNRDGICRQFTGERTAYWENAFILLNDAHYLMEVLERNKESFAESDYNHYMGETYFVRATVFYAMAKRFGGVPLITASVTEDSEPVARSSEEETWNQILADYDMAASLLKTEHIVRGYSNRYVALAYKSEAALYAGCVAKYNELVTDRATGLGLKTGVRVIGFDSDSWAAASKRYFREAYLAAREVMTSGKYSLYKTRWSAGNREAQFQNMVSMFSDLNSSENIYVKQYIYPTMTHGYDAYSGPFIFRGPLSAGTCPTLDFIELFDGFDRYADGTIKVTSGASNNAGNYLLFDTPMDFFKNAEPRLRAYVIFPGDQFRGTNIEIYAGVDTRTTANLTPLFGTGANAYAYSNRTSFYQSLSAYTSTGTGKTLHMSLREGTGTVLVPYGGGQMPASGANGPFFNNPEATITGFYGRKWLNTDPAFVPGEGKSDQPFILMRYADVLLNAAEAAVELALAGEVSPDGEDLLLLATGNVNLIRERAGATLLSGNIPANEAGRNIVRKERRKELAFEHKTKWDLRRWRVLHAENRNGFWGETRTMSNFSDISGYCFRGLYPFFSTQQGKWYFDARYQWINQKTFSYDYIDYYFAIPNEEVVKSPVIDQQPNR